jgi:hypothetical protein
LKWLQVSVGATQVGRPAVLTKAVEVWIPLEIRIAGEAIVGGGFNPVDCEVGLSRRPS